MPATRGPSLHYRQRVADLAATTAVTSQPMEGQQTITSRPLLPLPTAADGKVILDISDHV